MNKSEFMDWKQHPVTQEVFLQLKSRINELYEMLGDSAGQDSLQDSQFVGAIKAYKDMINIEFESEESQ